MDKLVLKLSKIMDDYTFLALFLSLGAGLCAIACILDKNAMVIHFLFLCGAMGVVTFVIYYLYSSKQNRKIYEGMSLTRELRHQRCKVLTHDAIDRTTTLRTKK